MQLERVAQTTTAQPHTSPNKLEASFRFSSTCKSFQGLTTRRTGLFSGLVPGKGHHCIQIGSLGRAVCLGSPSNGRFGKGSLATANLAWWCCTFPTTAYVVDRSSPSFGLDGFKNPRLFLLFLLGKSDRNRPWVVTFGAQFK